MHIHYSFEPDGKGTLVNRWLVLDVTMPVPLRRVTEKPMDTDALTNPTVRAAIAALQKGDRKAWSALFEPDAKLYDDGSPRSLEEFTRHALGHERFTAIDRVENNGLDLVGAFHADKWGDFRAYFKFQFSQAGKIKRLDIGQAK